LERSDTSSHGGVDFLPWWLNEVAWSDKVAGNRSLDVFSTFMLIRMQIPEA